MSGKKNIFLNIQNNDSIGFNSQKLDFSSKFDSNVKFLRNVFFGKKLKFCY